jgi:hypothetical protein
VGLGKSTATRFGKTHSVSLGLILRTAFVARVHVLDLLQHRDTLSGFTTRLSVHSTNGQLSGRRNSQNILALLKAATAEIPPPSISQVAARLGYTSSGAVRSYSPDLCDQINANFRNSPLGREARSVARTRLQTDEAIEAALTAALEQRPCPSLTQVAKSLGYTASLAIKVRFPKLCQALVDKGQDPLVTRRKRVEEELKQIPEKHCSGNRFGGRHPIGISHRVTSASRLSRIV